VGQNIHFSCSASDPDGDALSYSWVSSQDGTINSSSSFDTSGLSEGVHVVTVSVSDGHGNNASASVAITLIVDGDLDGLPDSWEELYGSDTTSLDPNDDMDGDAYSNIAEYLGGTDPADPESYPGMGSASGGVSCAAGGSASMPAAALAMLFAAVIVFTRPSRLAAEKCRRNGGRR
jgi:hypothetical protein